MTTQIVQKTLIVILAFIFCFSISSCSENKHEPKPQSKKPDYNKIKNEYLINLANKYNAIYDWDQKFNEAGFDSIIYTINLQEVLFSKGKNPIAFTASYLMSIKIMKNIMCVSHTPSIMSHLFILTLR